MNYSVESYRDFEGKLHWDLVIKEVGLPACFWLSCHLKESYQRSNTALTYAYQAKFHFEYFESQNIDISERIESGAFLTKSEFDDLITHCLYKVGQSPTNKKVVSIHQYSSKTLDNLIYATQSSQSRVSANTTRLRINALSAFIVYVYTYVHAGNVVPEHVEAKYEDLKARFSRFTKRLKDDNAVVKDVYEKAISTDIYFKFLEIIQPSHPENVWGKRSRLRNHVMVQILNETGVRRSALCKLKISDLKTDRQPRIRITITPNDPTDTRAKPASQKTQAHTSPISRELMSEIKLYIQTDRSKYAASNDHDFIFVAEKGYSSGQPLSLTNVTYLFKSLSKKLGFRIHPHLLRHKWQEIIETAAEKKGYSFEQINDMRKFANGWSENTLMLDRYNQFKNAVAVAEISKEAQEGILKGLKELSKNGQ